MTMTTAPHAALRLVTPDEVAECWDGIDTETYQALWDTVAHYEPIDVEDCGPADVIGINSVASLWEHFSEDIRRALNAAARAQEVEDDGGFDEELWTSRHAGCLDF
jgi:hypothetical protein